MQAHDMANLNSPGMERTEDFSLSSVINSIDIHEPFLLSPKDFEMIEEAFFSTDEFLRTEDMDNLIDSYTLDERNSSNLSKDISSSGEIEEPTIVMAPRQFRGMKTIVPQVANEETNKKVRKRPRKPRKMTRGTQTDENILHKLAKTQTKPILSKDNGQDEQNSAEPQRLTRAKKKATNGSKNAKVGKKSKAKKLAPVKPTNKKANIFTEEEVSDVQKGFLDLSNHQTEDNTLEETLIVSSGENGSTFERDSQVPSLVETNDPGPKAIAVSKPNQDMVQKGKKRTFVIQVKVPEEEDGSNYQFKGHPLEKKLSPILPANENHQKGNPQVEVLAELETPVLHKNEIELKETAKDRTENKKWHELEKKREDIREMEALKRALRKVEKKNKQERREAAKLKMLNAKYKKYNKRGHYSSDPDTSTDSSSFSLESSSLFSSTCSCSDCNSTWSSSSTSDDSS